MTRHSKGVLGSLRIGLYLGLGNWFDNNWAPSVDKQRDSSKLM